MNTDDRRTSTLTRREALRRSVLVGAAIACTDQAAIASSRIDEPASRARKRALRFAHPTDIHVQPELNAGEGMHACFAHMLALKDPPSLIITGGDLPMDTASTPAPRSKEEWNLFLKVLKDSIPSDLPIYHTIGNHDVFGRDRAKAKADGSEPFFAKKWFLQNFQYDRTYRSFDRAGWHFVILDSIELGNGVKEFTARLDPEQLEWFKGDLAKTPATTPIVIISHVPIVSVANYFDRDDEEWKTDGPALEIKSSRMHVDCRDLDALFQKYPNIKLCLSGHLHLLDRCVYNGITHICDGAVSGAKWHGPKRQTHEGYGLIDLYDDGTFEHQYVDYGWHASTESAGKKRSKKEE